MSYLILARRLRIDQTENWLLLKCWFAGKDCISHFPLLLVVACDDILANEMWAESSHGCCQASLKGSWHMYSKALFLSLPSAALNSYIVLGLLTIFFSHRWDIMPWEMKWVCLLRTRRSIIAIINSKLPSPDFSWEEVSSPWAAVIWYLKSVTCSCS